MASAGESVEQLLATRTATPIAQLAPDLPDQATRKVHGEITIVWPYSSISKSVAFLLAEPDFRLRRDKGQVRIQLNGPSAEAVGHWDLGSGDEVTLALDGVEWARDEEPARPPGSRSDWQLKFAGTLKLKVTLGETHETKLVSIDQPVPAEPEETTEPIPFAEIDTALFDDEPATQAGTRTFTNEYASPIFKKRSRASYAPLFDFDLDKELEEDDGRRGKGRKRPRYSVQNGRWGYREESNSPEPELVQGSSSPAPVQDGDVVMQDTKPKPQMTDEACQTVEEDLLPQPQSLENTPSKVFGSGQPSSSLLSGRSTRRPSGATTDPGVQAAKASPRAAAADQQRPTVAGALSTNNPFGLTPGSPGLPRLHSTVQAGFGMSQITSSSHGQSAQQPQAQPILGISATPHQSGFGQPTSAQAVFGQPTFGQPTFGQPVFGQPVKGQSSTLDSGQAGNVSTGFGSRSGSLVDSVRFGFGQQSQSTPGSVPYASSQNEQETHYQSEAYPDPQQLSAQASQHSHQTSRNSQQHESYHQNANEIPEDSSVAHRGDHEVPSWATEPQKSDTWHAGRRVDVPDESHSESSVEEGTPEGMIPPQVEDGTRKRDEMREYGILSQPVFEQDVPREAIPHGRESSADEDEDSMDSDEQADYDEDEKGDDYDMRNYDRISDDDEGFDVERDPLPEENLLDEDDEYDEDEEDYDEERYEEDDPAAGRDDHQMTARSAPRPRVQNEPIVIDLLSDTDDDEDQGPPPPQRQLGRQQMDGTANCEPEDVRKDQLSAETPLPKSQPRHHSVHSEWSKHDDESAKEDINKDKEELLSGNERPPREDTSGESESEEPADEASKIGVDKPVNAKASNDAEPSGEVEATIGSLTSVPQVEEATSSPGHSHREVGDDNEGSIIEEVPVQDEPAGKGAREALQQTGQVSVNESDETNGDGGEQATRPESSQMKPMELDASLQTQTGKITASFEIYKRVNAAADLPSSPHDQETRSETGPDATHLRPVDLTASFQTLNGDIAASFQTQVMETDASPDLLSSSQGQEPSQEMAQDIIMSDNLPDNTAENQSSASEEDGSDKVVDEGAVRQPSVAEPELSDEEAKDENMEGMDTSPDAPREASETKSFEGFSDEQQDAPPSPSESQQRGVRVTKSVEISMTTASSRIGTQLTDQEVTGFRKQETEIIMLSRPDVVGEDDGVSFEDQRAPEVAEDRAASREEPESDAESGEDEQAPPHDEAQVDEDRDLVLPEARTQPTDNGIAAASSPRQKRELTETCDMDREEEAAARAENTDEDLHDASELVQTEPSPSVAHIDDRASFVTANSEASESKEMEEAESPSMRKLKRGFRLRARHKEIGIPKPARASRRGQHVPPDESPSPRTTRSQTMSFPKAASPNQDQEDQFARAGLRSPSRRKVSATSASKVKSDMVKRLSTEMPECAPLKDLKSYHKNTLDVAAVATSANTTPLRTKARQYVSSFTISDPSTAPQGVIEVSLFRAHKDYLPEVKPGDSILLRRFTVTSLSGRGFGLRTEDESSWAVFNTDGEPQTRGPPVELSKTEKSYLVDLRGWYTALDESSKGKLATAVGEVVDKGRESRGEK